MSLYSQPFLITLTFIGLKFNELCHSSFINSLDGFGVISW